MNEFDKLQRLFLNGKYHSTSFNKWFSDVLSQAKRQEGVRILEEAKEKQGVDESTPMMYPIVYLSDLTNIINNHD